MDTNIDMETVGNRYAIRLRNKKRRSFNLVDPSSLMTMTSSSNPIPNLAHTNTPNHVVPTLMHTLTSPINIPNNKNISGSTIVGTSSSISLLWFHYPSTYKLCDCFMPNELSLVDSNLLETWYTLIERDFITYIFGDNPSTTDNHG
jgi:hypothetical protein